MIRYFWLRNKRFTLLDGTLKKLQSQHFVFTFNPILFYSFFHFRRALYYFFIFFYFFPLLLFLFCLILHYCCELFQTTMESWIERKKWFLFHSDLWLWPTKEEKLFYQYKTKQTTKNKQTNKQTKQKNRNREINFRWIWCLRW